eukprot:48946-Chlamydomonas_euryale.AAC.1
MAAQDRRKGGRKGATPAEEWEEVATPAEGCVEGATLAEERGRVQHRLKKAVEGCNPGRRVGREGAAPAEGRMNGGD